MLWRVAFGVLLLLVVGTPLARGTVHPPSLGVATLLATAAFLASSLNYVWRRRPPAVPVLGWVFALLAVYTLFQTIDLPASLIKMLSAQTHETFSYALEKIVLYGDAASRPLSLDPPATLLQALVALGLTMALVVAYRAGRRETGLRDIQIALLVGATAVMLVSFGFRMFQFSLWPDDRGVIHQPGVLSTTFRNINHFAAYLVLALPTAIGCAIDVERSSVRRSIAAGLACVIAIAIVLSRSRGGLVSGVVGAMALTVLLRSGTSIRKSRRALWGFALVAIVAGSVAMWFGAKRIFGKFSPEVLEQQLSDEGRVGIWKDSVKLVKAFPTIGVGRGAFAVAFPAVKTDPIDATYTHPENEPILWLVEWGVIAGGLFVVALLITLLLLAFTGFGCVEAGGVAGLIGLAIHNLVDFNLEAGGIAFPAAILLGALLGRRSRLVEQKRLEAGRSVRRRRKFAFVALGLGPAAIAVGVLVFPRAVKHDRDAEIIALRRLAANTTVTNDAWMRATRGVLDRHPVDPYLHLAVAQVLMTETRRDDELAIYFLNRAIFFNPSAADPHRLAVGLLLATGNTDQAVVEARLAIERSPASAIGLLSAIHRAKALDAASFKRVLPYPVLRAEFLGWLTRSQLWAVAVPAAREILEDDPENSAALLTLIERAFLDKDFAGAEGRLALLERQREARGVVRYWRGRISEAARREDDAIKAYRAALKAEPPFVSAAFELERIYIGRRRFREAIDILESVSLIDTSPGGRANLHFRLANVLTQSGDLVGARRELERARRLAPNWATAAWALVSVRERGRDIEGAIAICRELREIPGNREAAEKKIRELEAKRAGLRERGPVLE
ncbi:MAG: O-antigen ligase family protein [Deltaproteobacteria bacterium]|nr:O-antigen ligase family protein [Deltaproteobacteria bacterium]